MDPTIWKGCLYVEKGHWFQSSHATCRENTSDLPQNAPVVRILSMFSVLYPSGIRWPNVWLVDEIIFVATYLHCHVIIVANLNFIVHHGIMSFSVIMSFPETKISYWRKFHDCSVMTNSPMWRHFHCSVWCSLRVYLLQLFQSCSIETNYTDFTQSISYLKRSLYNHFR